MKKFRLWCVNKSEWEKDAWFISPDGVVFDMKRFIPMATGTHILEQCTGKEDKNGLRVFGGDYIKCGKLKYRVEYIKEFLAYCVFTDQEWDWYKEGSNHFKYCYQEDNEKNYFLREFESYEIEVCGNIHEKE